MVEILNLDDIRFEKRDGRMFYYWKGEELGTDIFTAKDNLIKKLLGREILIENENAIFQRLRVMELSVQ